MKPVSVLVVDDRVLDRKLVERALAVEGYEVTTAGNWTEAVGLLKMQLFDAVLSDIRMQGIDGIELLREVKRHDPGIAVVMMTADPTVDTAVGALKEGAYDYLVKPLNLDELRSLMLRIAERSNLHREVSSLRTRLGEHLAAKELVGTSPAMARLKSILEKVAPTDSAVLIEGESGTGKELVAAAIHRHSGRSKAAFIPVNCGAIPAELLESEFFGHVRGAFTGAVGATVGLFRSAHGGTIFLDEVTELALPLQVKLLRVLQEKEVRPVGSSASKTVDVRVIAATNRSVEEAVHRGVFRQDLFYRLNVVRICTPPLRECRTDIPALAAHFIRQLNVRFRREVRGIQAAALAALSAHDFPGNVRELEHLLESAYALGATSTITLGDLPALSAGPRSELAPFECAGVLPSLSDALARVERELIGRALAVHGDNRDEAAQALGLSVRTFYRRLKALGLG